MRPAVWASLTSPRCRWPPQCQRKHNSVSSTSPLLQFERCGQSWPVAVLLAVLSLGAVLGPALCMSRAHLNTSHADLTTSHADLTTSHTDLTISHADHTRLAARRCSECPSKPSARVARLAGLPPESQILWDNATCCNVLRWSHHSSTSGSSRHSR